MNYIEEIKRSKYPNKFSFECFLKSIHADNYIGTDDDMGDDFEDWLGELEPEDVIGYAEQALRMALDIDKSPIPIDTEYWTIVTQMGEFIVNKSWWKNDDTDKGRLKNQLYFKTEEEANKKLKEIINSLA